MEFIKWLWLRFFKCNHENQELKETIHGDKIIHLGYKRSIWVCPDCARIHYSEYLDKP